MERGELGIGSFGIGGRVEEVLSDSGEEEVGVGLDFLSERGDLARRAAKAVKSCVHLEVEAGDTVLGGGGGLVMLNCGGRFDEDIQVVEDGLAGFDREGGGHDHNGAFETRIAEGDAFLDARDAEPVGSIAGGEPADGDKTVAVSIGFADETDFWC